MFQWLECQLHGLPSGRERSGSNLGFPSVDPLAKGDDDVRNILKFTEPMGTIDQLDVQFHGIEKNRNIMTVVIKSEKRPGLLGFKVDDTAH